MNAMITDVGANLCTLSPSAMIICDIINNVTARRVWQKNGVTLSTTDSKITVTPSDNDDRYTCIVTNDCSSDTATTTVFSKPVE